MRVLASRRVSDFTILYPSLEGAETGFLCEIPVVLHSKCDRVVSLFMQMCCNIVSHTCTLG